MFRNNLNVFLSLLLVCLAPAAADDAGLPRFGRFGAHTSLARADFEDSARLRDLIRAGNLYLSLADALALAVENNLDLELQRAGVQMSNTELLRAKGGGTLRGLLYTLSESPAGVGGPASPLLTAQASIGRGASGSSVANNATSLGGLSEPQVNLSVLGATALSNGSSVPNYDPALVGQLNWTHQTTPQSNSSTSGTNSLVTSTALANAGYQQGFGSGGQVNAFFNNSRQSINSLRSGYSPFTGSSLGVSVTQPLLRGFGLRLNRRFIRMARNEQKIGSLLFQQQLVATVYGVVRLYTDLVSLYEDAKVKEQSLASAQKLYSDTQAQVEEGTLAPVELTRSNALVFSSRQDLINAQGLLEEQEAILKNVLTRGNQGVDLLSARIIPTDTLSLPEKDDIRPIQDLLAEAYANRPDLSQAGLQINNSEISLEGARSAVRPQVDLVGTVQNAGLTGAVNPLAGNPDVPYVGGFGGLLEQLATRKFPTYGAGIQVTLPFHNRVAEADLARDELQVRQSRIRLKQLENQARLEVADALIAMRRSRASYEAAVQARLLQRESLEAEQVRFEAGASTGFFVIQYQTLLSQASSTEIVAKGAYFKARAALERATGTILQVNGVRPDSAYLGHK